MLPNAQLKSILVAPVPPSAPNVPPVTIKVARVSTNSYTRQFARIIAPLATPKQVAPIDDAVSAPDVRPALVLLKAIRPRAICCCTVRQLYRSTPPPSDALTARRSVPVRIGTGVAEANLINRVQPLYPPLAKAARVQGSVEFTALISKEGRIENLKLVSGHRLLVKAARDAILQRRYRPTMLNGMPVKVLTSIVVRFSLAM
jgi:protein TonB